MELSGAKLFVEALKKENVDVLFAYPGGSVITIFDELYTEPSIEIILPRHEQGLVHAADGYARATGKIGVCLVTSGPGATNTITGLATAYYDSIPLVCFTGQVPTSMIGTDAFQEADTFNITRSVTKHNYYVSKREDLGHIIQEAFYVAGSGRPGPVVVDLPSDILKQKGNSTYSKITYIEGYSPEPLPDNKFLKEAAKLISYAKKPVILAGGGLQNSKSSQNLRNFVEKTTIPVVSTLMGLGSFPGNHELFVGMLGMHGSYAANHAIQNSDVLIAIGTRFSDRITGNKKTFAPNAKVIHIDIDASEHSKNIPAEISLTGDAGAVLEKLSEMVSPLEISEWNKTILSWKKSYPLANETQLKAFTPALIISTVRKLLPEAVVVTDVGQHQMWAAQFYTYIRPRSFLTSGGLGTMGFGFPAAIGAKIGTKDTPVVCFSGDGSIQMNIQELATAVQQELPIIVIIMNNGYLGMVRQWQELFYNRKYSSTCLRRRKSCPKSCNKPNKNCPEYIPDFVKLAKAYGANGFRVENIDEFKNALKEAISSKKTPTLIEALIEREENVFPMVPAGGSLDDMFGF